MLYNVELRGFGGSLTRMTGGEVGSFGGGSGEECVVTSLVPLGIAVALIKRGSNKGVSKM